jgi:hypothetical protein
MPEPYGGWEGDPEDVARMERQRIANAEQIAGIRWSVELAPERVAERAGVDTTSPEFDLVKRLCAKWVALLTG